MTPKSLLRLPAAQSKVSELTSGAYRPVLDDPTADGRRDEVTRLVLCGGKVYYDIQGHEERERMEHVAVARLEEFYPFPTGELKELVGRYPNLEGVIWAQEEPRNMGGLTFVGPRLRGAIPREVQLGYVGRTRPSRAGS
jgi:2-oxoglutarate dehydrogenase E1 component